MKQIKYGDASFALRLEFPENWDVESITGVTLGIKNRGASVLLAAADATIYAATTISADASAGAAYIVLAGGEGFVAPTPGDIMIIAASDDGDRERIVVHHYDSTNRYVYPEHELTESHASGAAVYGAWATYALDASDTDTFSSGLTVVATWTPDSDDEAVTEEYIVATTSLASGGLWADMANVYPTVYDMIGNRDKDRLEVYITTRFQTVFKSRGLDMNRIVDQSVLDTGLLLFARHVVLGDSSVDGETYTRAKVEFTDWLTMILDSPIWQDLDQDGAEDEDTGEIQPHYVENLFRVI